MPTTPAPPTIPPVPAPPLSNLATGISVARYTAGVTAICGYLGALVMVVYTEQTNVGEQRPFVGLALAVVGITSGVVTLLLFLAGWAETWRASILERR